MDMPRGSLHLCVRIPACRDTVGMGRAAWYMLSILQPPLCNSPGQNTISALSQGIRHLQKAYTVHHTVGAVLPIWKVLADTVIPTEEKKFKGDMEAPRGKDHARVVRLKLDSGEPIIGLSLMSDDVQKVSFSTWHDPAHTRASTGWSVKHLDTSNIFAVPCCICSQVCTQQGSISF